jgi:glycosyltransferase involved in cell wall biosynthesis
MDEGIYPATFARRTGCAMKILVVQDRLRSGGTERQSILLTRAFGADGHAASLLTFRPGGVLRPTASDLPLQALQPFDFGLDWCAPGLVRHARRVQPDIVLAMGRMANCQAERLQRGLPRAAVVATLRTGRPLPWLFRRGLRGARHVVANSREARAAAIARHGVPPEKASVIYNALVFPPAGAEPHDEALRARLGANPATAVLLSVAMFRREKGQRELIEIAAGLPAGLDWQLWLAGDGPTRGACERLAERHRLGHRVKFLGFHADPGPLYGSADLAVHASASESLSNFLIEAQARGLPAVASAAQGIGECFVPERTGFVIPRGDRAAFRSALLRLLGEPRETRLARAAEARAFARSTFDPRRQVAAYLELFQKLLPS